MIKIKWILSTIISVCILFIITNSFKELYDKNLANNVKVEAAQNIREKNYSEAKSSYRDVIQKKFSELVSKKTLKSKNKRNRKRRQVAKSRKNPKMRVSQRSNEEPVKKEIDYSAEAEKSLLGIKF